MSTTMEAIDATVLRHIVYLMDASDSEVNKNTVYEQISIDLEDQGVRDMEAFHSHPFIHKLLMEQEGLTFFDGYDVYYYCKDLYPQLEEPNIPLAITSKERNKLMEKHDVGGLSQDEIDKYLEQDKKLEDELLDIVMDQKKRGYNQPRVKGHIVVSDEEILAHREKQSKEMGGRSPEPVDPSPATASNESAKRGTVLDEDMAEMVDAAASKSEKNRAPDHAPLSKEQPSKPLDKTQAQEIVRERMAQQGVSSVPPGLGQSFKRVITNSMDWISNRVHDSDQMNKSRFDAGRSSHAHKASPAVELAIRENSDLMRDINALASAPAGAFDAGAVTKKVSKLTENVKKATNYVENGRLTIADAERLRGHLADVSQAAEGWESSNEVASLQNVLDMLKGLKDGIADLISKISGKTPGAQEDRSP